MTCIVMGGHFDLREEDAYSHVVIYPSATPVLVRPSSNARKGIQNVVIVIQSSTLRLMLIVLIPRLTDSKIDHYLPRCNEIKSAP